MAIHPPHMSHAPAEQTPTTQSPHKALPTKSMRRFGNQIIQAPPAIQRAEKPATTVIHHVAAGCLTKHPILRITAGEIRRKKQNREVLQASANRATTTQDRHTQNPAAVKPCGILRMPPPKPQQPRPGATVFPTTRTTPPETPTQTPTPARMPSQTISPSPPHPAPFRATAPANQPPRSPAEIPTPPNAPLANGGYQNTTPAPATSSHQVDPQATATTAGKSPGTSAQRTRGNPPHPPNPQTTRRAESSGDRVKPPPAPSRLERPPAKSTTPARSRLRRKPPVGSICHAPRCPCA